jgi:hypothetical protein
MARPLGSPTKAPRLPFKQRDVERAIRAVHARGLPVGRVDIDPKSGFISIVTLSGELVMKEEIRKPRSA